MDDGVPPLTKAPTIGAFGIGGGITSSIIDKRLN
jgi:hypothetical protein